MGLFKGTAAPSTATLSPMWTTAIVAAVLLAVASGVTTTVLTVRSLRHVGEGELLASDARQAASMLLGGESRQPARLVRHIRNELEIEAVSLVDADGLIAISTSDSTPVGTPVDPLLLRALDRGAFAAVASPLADPVSVDGVLEWDRGAVLYQAMQPTPDGGGLLLSYDLSEMLERRAEASRISPLVTPLAIGSGLLLLTAGLLSAARARAAQTRREIDLEADFLRRRTEELQQHNVELEVARAETERALELAEEKNRIRSEFVLMINHELRTPLTGVVTGARVLEASPNLDESDRNVLAGVLSEGERLDSLISQMLAVARVENRGLVANPKEQPLSDLLDRLRKAHRSAKVRVTDDLVPDELDVYTDATTLTQLVASLVDNAFTHGARHAELIVTKSFPAATHFEIGCRLQKGAYVLVVDDGPGIDHHFLPRAFEKWEKHSFSSGTGLGLYMARMMAESIEASLSVITGCEGTVFAVGIPTLAVNEEQIA